GAGGGVAGGVAGAGRARVLGRPDPVNPHWAAVANGQSAHSMELDDTFLEGSIHTEASVFAACMALAEEQGLGGRRFVEAAVAGGGGARPRGPGPPPAGGHPPRRPPPPGPG